MSDATIIENEAPKKTTLVGRLLLPIILILTSGGVGYGFSKAYVEPLLSSAASTVLVEGSDPPDMIGQSEQSSASEPLTIVTLEPVVTNLADPSDVWVRAEFSLMFTGSPEDGLIAIIQDDFVAYLRTIKLQNLEGASGFQHLMEDLNERASIKSEQRVSRVLVRAFLVE